MPRVGYAYQINDKTVLRGGYGIYFGPVGQPRTDVNLLTYNRTTNFIASNDNGLDFASSRYVNCTSLPSESCLIHSSSISPTIIHRIDPAVITREVSKPSPCFVPVVLLAERLAQYPLFLLRTNHLYRQQYRNWQQQHPPLRHNHQSNQEHRAEH